MEQSPAMNTCQLRSATEVLNSSSCSSPDSAAAPVSWCAVQPNKRHCTAWRSGMPADPAAPTLSATAVISGPMPSPGSTAILWVAAHTCGANRSMAVQVGRRRRAAAAAAAPQPHATRGALCTSNTTSAMGTPQSGRGGPWWAARTCSRPRRAAGRVAAGRMHRAERVACMVSREEADPACKPLFHATQVPRVRAPAWPGGGSARAIAALLL